MKLLAMFFFLVICHEAIGKHYLVETKNTKDLGNVTDSVERPKVEKGEEYCFSCLARFFGKWIRAR